ncbi:polysaccharide lyase family 7 protein [Myriangium duriaei CBS 260.36]|uniref:Polysaccharide lyase family 7 protein n=1 Tax=Myriangium duriaei CBS 260.36 TaxID=1168546 RepID=A0A9P4MFU0_9PEZI|nr:polysaccharide lyase family 7 protein [Myriangium duriaei CBS 260.36]
MARLLVPILTTLGAVTAALNPKCAPGGNFDLNPWTLSLQSGSPGDPTTITTSQLTGCNGFDDHSTFTTAASDGSLVMRVCGSPDTCSCVTSANSKHCRTEFHEADSWQPTAKRNRLLASLSVPVPDNSKYGTVIGQIHIDKTVSIRPVCLLLYNSKGDITFAVEKTRDGGDSTNSKVGNVKVGSKFSYEIRYEGGKLSIGINGGAQEVVSQNELDNPLSYFKAGNYNQGSSASEVHFYTIEVQH